MPSVQSPKAEKLKLARGPLRLFWRLARGIEYQGGEYNMRMWLFLYHFRGAICVSRNLMAILKGIPTIMIAGRFNRAPRFEALPLLSFNRLAARSWGD